MYNIKSYRTISILFPLFYQTEYFQHKGVGIWANDGLHLNIAYENEKLTKDKYTISIRERWPGYKNPKIFVTTCVRTKGVLHIEFKFVFV